MVLVLLGQPHDTLSFWASCGNRRSDEYGVTKSEQEKLLSIARRVCEFVELFRVVRGEKYV